MIDPDSLDNRSPRMLSLLMRTGAPFVRHYHRGEIRGVERIPTGPALYVGNHNAGYWTPDTGIFFEAVWRTHGIDALPYGLTHEWDLKIPGLNMVLPALGSVRASHENAHKAFKAGKKVLVYPGGDLDSMRPFRHRNKVVFGGRQGYIRLALTARVPIIPVVAAGAHSTSIIIDDMRWLAKMIRADKIFRTEVWPLTLSMPLGLTLGPLVPYVPYPSKILMEVMEPIRFFRRGKKAAEDDAYVQECADKVERRMQETLTRLAEERRAMKASVKALQAIKGMKSRPGKAR